MTKPACCPSLPDTTASRSSRSSIAIIERARELAEAYKISSVHDDVAAIGRDDADGVVLATPPAHHAPATLELVGRGLHVFVEKPMAISTADAEAMVRAADQAGVVLSVGLYRRLLPVSRLLRGMLESEMLGRPLWVDIEEGGEYSWELATLSVLDAGGRRRRRPHRPRHSPAGPAVLPAARRGLGRRASPTTRAAESKPTANWSWRSQTRWGAVPARVELSRTRQLRGTIQVACEHGTLELVRGDFCTLLLHGRPDHVDRPGHRSGCGRFRSVPGGVTKATSSATRRFAPSSTTGSTPSTQRRDPQLSGRSVVPVVRTVEACYASPAG